MTDYCNEEGDHQLLVEGTTDCHATIALWNKHYNAVRFCVKTCNSDTNVLSKMNALIASSERPKTIGVILDADNEPAERRFDQIKDKIHSYNYNFPERLNKTGTIIESVESYPRLGIWIMPDNLNKGIIEDFYLKLAPSSIIDYAKSVVEKASKDGHTTFRKPHQSKAIIHTYLSWQDEPGSPLGTSITALKFDIKDLQAIEFTSWLDELFQ